MHFVNAKGILSAKNGMNIYRGCTHGCIYCDSRSTCYGMTHDFEDIEVKQNAPELLEIALRSKRKKCMIGTGAMCDPYMHCEEELKLTRKCLEIIDRYGFGATIHTKSNRILRDLDLLKSINKESKCVVQMTLTTYDEQLCKKIEPNVSTTKERVETLKILREGDREYFYDALDKYFPGLRYKFHKKYGYAYEISSDNQRELMRLLKTKCKENSIMCDINKCFEYLNEFPEKYEQMTLF